MQDPVPQNKEEDRSRKPNKGKGFPSNSLDRKQRDKSPLGYTLGRKKEEKEIEISGGKGVEV